MTKYTHDLEWTLERGEEAMTAYIEFGIEERGSAPSGLSGPPEYYDPGSGWVFYINNQAETELHGLVTLTDSELDAIHDYLTENPPEDDGDYYDDYD